MSNQMTWSLMLERMDYLHFLNAVPSGLDIATNIERTIKVMHFDAADELNVGVDIQRRIVSNIKGGYFVPNGASIKRAVTLSVLNVVKADIHAKMTNMNMRHAR